MLTTMSYKKERHGAAPQKLAARQFGQFLLFFGQSSSPFWTVDWLCLYFEQLIRSYDYFGHQYARAKVSFLGNHLLLNTNLSI
jgi:hypothetical protein